MAAPSSELDQTVNQVAATCAAVDQAVEEAVGIPLPRDHEGDNQPQRRNLGRHTLLEAA